MKLKLFFCLAFINLVAHGMKKGFLNKPKKEKSFVCDICFENSFLSYAPQKCSHMMCVECVLKILKSNGLENTCPMCRAPLPVIKKDYKVNFHNFDDLRNNPTPNNLNAAAIFASSEGKLSLLQKLFNLGFDVKRNPAVTAEVVIEAIAAGHLNIVMFLDELNVDMHMEPIKGANLITLAAQVGEFQIAKFLVNKGVAVKKANHEGMAPIHIAATKGHLSIVELLANSGADIDQAAHGGGTPLHWAIRSGNFAVVKFLVGRGANLKKADNDGDTPAKFAMIMKDNSESNQQIADYFADLQRKKE